jgi:hypothetical protein
MNRSSALTIAAVIALVGMTAVPMAASAATDRSVDVEQNPDTGEGVVTVTTNGTAVENETVTVSSEAAYAGTGAYDTDENGTVVLPEPNETVSVVVNVSADNSTASTQVNLVPREESLDVSAEQTDDGSTTVTVTQYDEAVENASVEVITDAEIDGNYTTDANGTLTIEQPADSVNATIVATDGDRTAETGVELTGVPLDVSVDQRDDGVLVTVTEGSESVENATVEVGADGDYAGTGTYETDADGEVVLSLPSENVTAEVTAIDDNETATTTADLTVAFVQEEKPFGLAVSQFVSALQSATVDGPPGQVISEFVVGNNPGNTGEAPGQSGGAPGQSGDASGRSGSAGPGAADNGNDSDDAPGRSGDAPGKSGDGPGNSGDAPGNSDSAPGQDRDDTDDENETADESESESANGNAPDGAGSDTDEERDDAGDGQDTDAANDEDGEDESDAESGGESSDQNNGSEGNNGDAGGGSGSDSAPGNSGNAPGQN